MLLTKLDMSRAPPEIRYTIRVHADMTWKAFVYSMKLTTSQLTAGVPVLLSTTAALRSLLVSLDSGHICDGNRAYKDSEGNKAYKDSEELATPAGDPGMLHKCEGQLQGEYRRRCRRTDTPPPQKLT